MHGYIQQYRHCRCGDTDTTPGKEVRGLYPLFHSQVEAVGYDQPKRDTDDQRFPAVKQAFQPDHAAKFPAGHAHCPQHGKLRRAKFYVGGDGMSGSYTYATETIALRGYENGSLTPWGREGYAYTRFGVELHFPFMLQPTTTIYGLVFAEGGNAWTSVKDFSPFNIKRSAGAGVRIFLPMVGLMGIDWAYGFDRVNGQKGGSHFHFILGQEF